MLLFVMVMTYGGNIITLVKDQQIIIPLNNIRLKYCFEYLYLLLVSQNSTLISKHVGHFVDVQVDRCLIYLHSCKQFHLIINRIERPK